MELPTRVPCDFEIALDIYPGRRPRPRGAGGERLAARRPAETVRGPLRVPRLRAGLGRRVLRRPGHLRGHAQRLVQRPQRALPRVGPARAAPGHGLQPQLPGGRGTGPVHARSTRRPPARSGSRPTTRHTARPRARSRRSGSTPTRCCPASSPKPECGELRPGVDRARWRARRSRSASGCGIGRAGRRVACSWP